MRVDDLVLAFPHQLRSRQVQRRSPIDSCPRQWTVRPAASIRRTSASFSGTRYATSTSNRSGSIARRTPTRRSQHRRDQVLSSATTHGWDGPLIGLVPARLGDPVPESGTEPTCRCSMEPGCGRVRASRKAACPASWERTNRGHGLCRIVVLRAEIDIDVLAVALEVR